MNRLAFTMQLHPGQEAEYRRRHNAIWPELVDLLKAAGVEDYSIFLEPQTLVLFAYLRISDPQALDSLKTKDVMWRWWDQMKDIMDVHPDTSPVTRPLTELFYLP